MRQNFCDVGQLGDRINLDPNDLAITVEDDVCSLGKSILIAKQTVGSGNRTMRPEIRKQHRLRDEQLLGPLVLAGHRVDAQTERGGVALHKICDMSFQRLHLLCTDRSPRQWMPRQEDIPAPVIGQFDGSLAIVVQHKIGRNVAHPNALHLTHAILRCQIVNLRS